MPSWFQVYCDFIANLGYVPILDILYFLQPADDIRFFTERKNHIGIVQRLVIGDGLDEADEVNEQVVGDYRMNDGLFDCAIGKPQLLHDGKILAP